MPPPRPLRINSRAIKEKIFFTNFCCNLRIKITTYRNFDITLKFVGRYFYCVVTILSKKLGYFSPKIGGRKKNFKIHLQLFQD